MHGEVVVRCFAETDAPALTEVLHAAYAELAEMGLNFTAVDQAVSTTLARAGAGACWVAERGDELLGTVTMSYPPSVPVMRMSPTAARPGTVWLNQLAVTPQARGLGLAGTLVRTGLAWAREQGAIVVGLDTAIPATHLIELYTRWGFAERDTIHWEGKTYDSVVMTRSL